MVEVLQEVYDPWGSDGAYELADVPPRCDSPVQREAAEATRYGRPGEIGTVRDYTAGFQSIVIELPDLAEEYKRYRYILGLDPAIQQAVEQQLPTTLDRAIELASLADSIARRIVNTRGQGRAMVSRPVRERLMAQPAAVAQPAPMELGAVATPRDHTTSVTTATRWAT